MPKYTIRLQETVTTNGHCDFGVDAPSEREAAATVIQAYREARAAGAQHIELPDGQHSYMDVADASNRAARFFLLDDAGQTISELSAADH